MFIQFGRNLEDLARDQMRAIKIIIRIKNSNMQNHKNTTVGRAVILCEGILFNSCRKLPFNPIKGRLRGNRNESKGKGTRLTQRS